jgi:lipoyl(octanoyl) transferase
MTVYPAPFQDESGECSAAHAVHFHLLGQVDFDDCQQLQRRMVYEAGGSDNGNIAVILCEHPPLITIGRAGSRGHIRLTNEQLRIRRLAMRWVNRGGGCLLHAPGQLAVYPIVPLRWHGWTVGQYLRRLQQAMARTLEELHIASELSASDGGLWGRTGQLAACGVAVRDWTTYHGMFLNVNPPATDFGFVDVVDPLRRLPGQKTTMGSWFAERRRALSVPHVRATLIPHLAAALGTARYYLVTGHPWLSPLRSTWRAARHRAS